MIMQKIDKYDLFIPTLPHLKNKILKLTNNWKINILVSDDIIKNENLYNQDFCKCSC